MVCRLERLHRSGGASPGIRRRKAGPGHRTSLHYPSLRLGWKETRAAWLIPNCTHRFAFFSQEGCPCRSNCGRRASTFRSCALREQRTDTGDLPTLQVLRAQGIDQAALSALRPPRPPFLPLNARVYQGSERLRRTVRSPPRGMGGPASRIAQTRQPFADLLFQRVAWLILKLRASNEHSFIVRVPRARRIGQATRSLFPLFDSPKNRML